MRRVLPVLSAARLIGVAGLLAVGAYAGCSSRTSGTTAHSSAASAQPGAQTAAQPAAQRAQLFKNLGSFGRKVSTQNAEAQRYFDQAFTWMYSFNHDEAIRSYERAAELDPGLAMAYWGVALSHGPHINNPVMDEGRAKAAWDALQKAKANSARATPQERALITALEARYTDPSKPPIPMTFEERAPYDRAYAEAMAGVYERFPDDADIAALYAESLMDCRPWDLWDPATRAPRPEAPKVIAALERSLSLNAKHPGANHFYIHALEASTTPEKAVPSADRLRTLIPASGHMVHMPAHIDVRVGRWAEAAEQNRQAASIDAKYREISPTQGIYRIYMAHNDHFLAWSCMMLGRKQEALSAARHMIANIPEAFAKDAAPFVDPMLAVELEVMMRFGMWDEILKVGVPREYHPITAAYRHFARASAYAAEGQVSEAKAEQVKFRAAVAAVPEKAMMAQNPAHTVLKLADHTLAGEIAYREGSIDEAVEQLTRAVEIEDTLRYMEPPDWFQPVRHSLGAVLLASGRTGEAERVYRADLERWPENGWSLYGLSRCLETQNPAEAAKVKARFDKAWAHADTKIRTTCLCVKEQ